MDTRVLLALVFLFALYASDGGFAEGRNKKVVIHVPYKVKKIKHTHTIYKTIHHHHAHHDNLHHVPVSEEHEHFHHMHLHEEIPAGQHSQPIAGIGIPEFLPDVPMEMPIEMPDGPGHDIGIIHNRHVPIPIFRHM